MTVRRVVILDCLAVFAFVVGCGSADDAEGGSADDVEDDGTCELADGTYVFSYVTSTGDCGDIPDEVLIKQDGESFTAGMASGTECDRSAGCSDGRLAATSRCSVELGGDTVEARQVFTVDVTTGTGVLELRVTNPTASESCASTYRVTITMESGAGGVGGSGGPSGGTSGTAGEPMGGSSGASGAGECPECTALANGEACARDEDCMSGECGASVGGDMFCYGNADLGEPCAITQDCLGGLCIDQRCEDPAALSPNGSSCSESTECSSGNCGTSVAGDRFCYGFAQIGDECGITQDCEAGICRAGTCARPGSCSSDVECALNAVCDSSGECMQVCGANAIANDGGDCSCLPGFQWASTDPNDTNCVRPTTLAGCHLIGQDAAETYLGEVGSCYAAASVCNEYGSYGGEYASDSIFNPYGTFGSEYGAYSAFNPYSHNPPLLVCDGVVDGCVTVNEFACSGSTRVHPAALCSCQ
jgi:hypothetical protein